VPLTPHPDFDELVAKAGRLLAGSQAFRGVVYRVTGPKYLAPKDIIAGIGAMKAGGRWSPVGGFRAVYAATTPETTTSEALARNRYFGIPDYDALPNVMVALDVSVERLLDLTAPATRRGLGVSLTVLLRTDWRKEQDAGREALTQSIGRAAYEARFQGLLVPSTAVPGGVNVVVFPERLTGAGKLRVRNPDVLNRLVRPTRGRI
jgi:RES domain-containing protein